jgi:hypothetical protein
MAGPKLKKNVPFQPSGDTTRVVSLGGGTWAYLFDHLGKTQHLSRNSEEFAVKCKETDEVMNGKITAELENLGWTDVIERMNGDAESSEEPVAEDAN